jgi:vacuolar-type H+-ATPase subunit E/Vma4
MTTVDIATGLAPVRAALLAEARADAEATLAAARCDAAAVLAKAREEAARILTLARESGEVEAAIVVAARRSRARHRARAVELRARREAYEALCADARAAVCGLSTAAEYADIRDTLTAVAHAALGPDLSIMDAPGGGIVADSDGRRLDLSLQQFADSSVDAVAAEYEEAAWAP